MYQLLIVDDEIHAAEGLKSGYDWEELGISAIYTAYNIRQARDIFLDHAIDLMICDIEMPQGNGLELLAWVSENYSSTKSILLTCHSDFQYAKEAIHLGSLEYLLKPVIFSELKDVVRKAISIIAKEKRLSIINETYSNNQKQGMKEQSIVEKIKQYIAGHMDYDLTRESIASKFYLNSDYLSRVFKKETGFSISDYLIHERIRIAKDLLVNTDMPIKEIVSSVGYTNFSHFSKVFKNNTNLNPLTFRKKNQI
jgi:Response regulator containing CheY-like receiver domain and AraC-type DNA-binding domain